MTSTNATTDTCDRAPDRQHHWEDITTFGQAERVLLCAYCDAEKREPLNLDDINPMLNAS